MKLDRVPVPKFTYAIECRDAQGNLKWREKIHNLVTTGGMDNLLDTYFSGSGYTAAWYMGLMGSGTVADTDTMASHPGWSEITAITASARPGITGLQEAGEANAYLKPEKAAVGSKYAAHLLNHLALRSLPVNALIHRVQTAPSGNKLAQQAGGQ